MHCWQRARCIARTIRNWSRLGWGAGDVVMWVWYRGNWRPGQRAAIRFTDLRQTTAAFTARIEVFGEGSADIDSHYRLVDSSGRSLPLEAEPDANSPLANFPLVAGNSGNSVLLTGNPPMAWLEALLAGRGSRLYVRPIELLSASGLSPSIRVVAQPVELSDGLFFTASTDTLAEGGEEAQLSIWLPVAHTGLLVKLGLAVSGTALEGSDFTLFFADPELGFELTGDGVNFEQERLRLPPPSPCVCCCALVQMIASVRAIGS